MDLKWNVLTCVTSIKSKITHSRTYRCSVSYTVWGVLTTNGMPASNYRLCLDMCLRLIFLWACGKLSMQCKANVYVWLLCIDIKFWYPCPFIFFKCTKNNLLIVVGGYFSVWFFFSFFLFYTFSWPVWICGVGFVYIARFYPFCVISLCSLNVLFFCFSVYSPPYFLPLPRPFFLSLSDWEALNYVFSSTGFLPIWRELFRKRPTLGHLILNTVFNRSSFGWFISNVCFIFLESYILYLGNGILFCYLYWVSTLA